MTDVLVFLAACVSLLIVPGPTNALMFAAGASAGVQRAIVLSLAVLAAYVLSICLARLVLEPVLAAHPALARLTRAGIGLYVLWLAFRLWSSTMRRASGVAVGPGEVFLATLFNPKGFILAFVVLPQGGWEIWPYAVATAVVILAASATWGAMGATVAQLAGTGSRLAPRLSALALGLFGGMTLSTVFG